MRWLASVSLVAAAAQGCCSDCPGGGREEVFQMRSVTVWPGRPEIWFSVGQSVEADEVVYGSSASFRHADACQGLQYAAK